MADLLDIDEVTAALNITDSSHDAELETYIAAVTAHVESIRGVMPSSSVTEIANVVDLGDGTLRLMPTRLPVLEVASINDGTTTYSTGFTITPEGYVEHDSLWLGRWTIVYTAGYEEIPADLKLAALEDIRGLYQPGQIGPPASFGAFGIESTEVGPTYRPVRMWPRVDAWLERDVMPGIA